MQHDGYNSSEFGLNDIALLRLSQSVDLNASNCLEAIRLPMPDLNVDGSFNCQILGWGRTGQYFAML
jgi:Trypsin